MKFEPCAPPTKNSNSGSPFFWSFLYVWYLSMIRGVAQWQHGHDQNVEISRDPNQIGLFRRQHQGVWALSFYVIWWSPKNWTRYPKMEAGCGYPQSTVVAPGAIPPEGSLIRRPKEDLVSGSNWTAPPVKLNNKVEVVWWVESWCSVGRRYSDSISPNVAKHLTGDDGQRSQERKLCLGIFQQDWAWQKDLSNILPPILLKPLAAQEKVSICATKSCRNRDGAASDITPSTAISTLWKFIRWIAVFSDPEIMPVSPPGSFEMAVFHPPISWDLGNRQKLCSTRKGFLVWKVMHRALIVTQQLCRKEWSERAPQIITFVQPNLPHCQTLIGDCQAWEYYNHRHHVF